MSYQAYWEPSTRTPTVEFSASESKRTGLRIGRLLCGPQTDWTNFNPEEAITASDVDFVIMRYPADKHWIAEELQRSSLTSWIADTLLYLQVNTEQVSEPNDRYSLTSIDGFTDLIEQLVRGIFTDYRNHYSASSAFTSIDVAESYVDWTRHQLNKPTGRCCLLENADREPVALSILDSCSSVFDEITLIGVEPTFRQSGAFFTLLQHIAQMTRNAGKSRLVTSTQASNISSLRGLGRAGFLPVLALNTLHISKPEIPKQDA